MSPRPAEDYTACGVQLIAKNTGLAGGTARVNVYCEMPAAHDGPHAAAITWEDPPHAVRIAQGGAERILAAVAADAADTTR